MTQASIPAPPLAAGPRYQALAQSLIDDISTGRYPVGSFLPTEFELAERFGVSRHTVREAIRRLNELGLVTRQAGVGTRVRAQEGAARYVHATEGVSNLFQYVQEVHLVVTEKAEVIADETLAELLECRPGQAWLRVRGERFYRGETTPIALAEVYVAWRYRHVLDGVEAPDVPIYVMIEQAHGCVPAVVQQQVSAELMDAPTARRLGSETGAAALRVVRKYSNPAGEVFELAVNIHPGDRFSQSTTLRLEPHSAGRAR